MGEYTEEMLNDLEEQMADKKSEFARIQAERARRNPEIVKEELTKAPKGNSTEKDTFESR